MAISTAFCSSFKQELMRGQHIMTVGATVTGSSSSSVNYTSVSSTALLTPGMTVTGTNVGASSRIAAIVSATAFTMSVASTGTITGGTLTYAGHTFKLALYTSTATLDASTTAYSATNEASGVTAGGYALTVSPSMPSLTTTTAWTDFADLVISTVTVTARGCLIYNTEGGLNRAVSTHDFGADKTATAGDFTVVWPAADSTNAILRLA